MRRAYRYRLYPNVTQRVALATSLETHRRIYNDALSMCKNVYEKYGITLDRSDLYPWFSERRNADIAAEKAGEPGPHWLAHISSTSMRDTFGRVLTARKNFFRRVKNGEKPGYPRFRGADSYSSIPFENYTRQNSLITRGGEVIYGESDLPETPGKNDYRLTLFGVGKVRVRLHRPIRGRIKTMTVVREADEWYVCFSCDLGEVVVDPSPGPAVGIDVGLTDFYTSSDGEKSPSPRYLKEQLPKLRRAQRVASRRFRKGKKRSEQSRRRFKALKRVRKLHVEVKNRRKEHHHKTALELVRRYGTVCVEGLNIRGMLGNGKLARHIADAAWGGFVNTLKCKAESAGVRVIEVEPRGTSQECSGCGEVVKKDLSVRRHDCPHCGLSLDRDHNAAINILNRGLGRARAGPAGGNVTSLAVSTAKGKRRPRSGETSRRGINRDTG